MAAVNNLYSLTAHEAHRLLSRSEVTSVELTRSCLDRIEAVEDRVKAFVTITADLAMEQARAVDAGPVPGASSPLAGVPMQLKDVLCTRGVRTTCSSRMLEEFVPTYDATVAEKLHGGGAVLLGKGNMDEFAMGSSTESSAFHATVNPWALDRVPGGSSGGSAAAVASGEAVYALGSDTGGSIRQPASLCGVVGMKPTYGLVSRFGLVAFASSLDQVGPITRDVADCATVLGTIAGHDPRDSTSIPDRDVDYAGALTGEVVGMDGRSPLRIGIPREFAAEGLDPGVKEAVEVATSVLEGLGACLEEVSLPTTRHALACYYILALSECSANLARYDGIKFGYSYQDTADVWEAMEKTRQHGFGPEVKRRIMLGTYALSAGYYDAYYLKAQKVRTLIRREFDAVFRRVDLLATPTSPSVAFRLGERTADPLQMYLSDVYTVPASVAGLPAISVPCGFSGGLPVGLQLIGPHMSEATLLRTAHAFEQATSWHKLVPDL